MHCTPKADESVLVTAKNAVQEKTGISCTFRVLGSGFFRTYAGENLESFTHFDLLVSDDATGELVQNDEAAQYFWDRHPDFASDDMIPNMEVLAKLHKRNEPFFIEETFSI
jgi:hypothetical protein